MHTYIIAEIGQNHNGSLELARELIDMSAMKIHHLGNELPGVDAVKFTKRDLSEEMSVAMAESKYQNANSYGKTYMEHRKALEFNDKEHGVLFDYAIAKGLQFVETICSIGAMSVLEYVKPAYVKIASRDLDNLPLVRALAETKIPLILSTGMANIYEIQRAIGTAARFHDDITVLHCVSEYPAPYEKLNLGSITYLKEELPGFKIGYSDHTSGVLAPSLGVAMGAEMIEKHITVDRQLKGTDHGASMDMEGLRRVVRDIRNTETATTPAEYGHEHIETHTRLRRSIAARRAMKTGEYITEEDITLLSPGSGVKWHDRQNLLGRRLIMDVDAHEIIYPAMVEGRA